MQHPGGHFGHAGGPGCFQKGALRLRQIRKGFFLGDHLIPQLPGTLMHPLFKSDFGFQQSFLKKLTGVRSADKVRDSP